MRSYSKLVLGGVLLVMLGVIAVSGATPSRAAATFVVESVGDVRRHRPFQHLELTAEFLVLAGHQPVAPEPVDGTSAVDRDFQQSRTAEERHGFARRHISEGSADGTDFHPIHRHGGRAPCVSADRYLVRSDIRDECAEPVHVENRPDDRPFPCRGAVGHRQ